MCGFAGYLDMQHRGCADPEVAYRMADTLRHRGPDAAGHHTEQDLALAFRRLSIIDPEGGDQPMYNEDRSVVMVCNGEIFNHLQLRATLEEKGHRFRTRCDVEVLLHLYEEYGLSFLDRINGQFAFAIYDQSRRSLLLARDHAGIIPLFHTVADGHFIFGSEIKAILRHPSVRAEVDLAGLDQVLTFPGLVSPRTMFRDIESLKPGHYIVVEDGRVHTGEYWDLDYPLAGDCSGEHPERYYVETLAGLLENAVRYRLQADVPVGFYLSGGLDSSLIAAMGHRISSGTARHSFSIDFQQPGFSETCFQKLVAGQIGSHHHQITFGWPEISSRLHDAVYHSECPVHESYNTCSMALSETARRNGVPVVLSGEGADELFAGYIGYRFDRSGVRRADPGALHASLEREMRRKLWGDEDLFYERDYYAHGEIKRELYSEQAALRLESMECMDLPVVDHGRIAGRDPLHQRSYLDFKLRLADHLIADHGDRMAMANSVEARYPFLDRDVIDFARQIPPALKLKGLTEKYVLKQAAASILPERIIDREKFGFVAPGSPYLLKQGEEWVSDMLSYERIARQGYFNPDTIEALKASYTRDGFRLNLPFESDLLMIVLTFGIMMDAFGLPDID